MRKVRGDDGGGAAARAVRAEKAPRRMTFLAAALRAFLVLCMLVGIARAVAGFP